MKTQSSARKRPQTVAGVIAPGPRPTLLAAALVATAISTLFLICLGLVRLMV